MPLYSQNWRVTRLNFMPHFACFPVPKAYVTTTVTRTDELPIRTNCHVGCVACHIVALVALFAILAEAVRRGIHRDLVVGRLESNVLAGWMGRRANHGEHVGFRDELDGYRNAVFPCAERFVIRRGDEASVLGTVRIEHLTFVREGLLRRRR